MRCHTGNAICTGRIIVRDYIWTITYVLLVVVIKIYSSHTIPVTVMLFTVCTVQSYLLGCTYCTCAFRLFAL